MPPKQALVYDIFYITFGFILDFIMVSANIRQISAHFRDFLGYDHFFVAWGQRSGGGLDVIVFGLTAGPWGFLPPTVRD